MFDGSKLRPTNVSINDEPEGSKLRATNVSINDEPEETPLIHE